MHFKEYLEGHLAFVSSPKFVSSSRHPLTITSVRPDVMSACPIKIVAEEAWGVLTISDGHFVTGPFSASYELGHVEHRKLSRRLMALPTADAKPPE